MSRRRGAVLAHGEEEVSHENALPGAPFVAGGEGGKSGAMHFAARAAGTVVLGVALGALSAWYVLDGGGNGAAVANGPWGTNLAIGERATTPHTRAWVALHGLLALNRSETVYYTAFRDSDGETLNGNCVYRIEGSDPDARWWSITAYAGDDFLIPNEAGRYSISKNSVVRDADGRFHATVSRGPAAGNWIPSGAGEFSLTLRLYNPGGSILEAPATAPLPVIIREGCA